MRVKGKVETISTANRRGLLYASPGEGARTLLVTCCGDELADMLPDMAATLEPMVSKAISPFALASIPDIDWDRDYTPWPSIELQGRDMAGGADRFIAETQAPLLESAEIALGNVERAGVIGYSLGGLFALYAASLADAPFECAASVSGALWYERFVDYAASAPFPRLKRAYVSLGRKEAKVNRGPMARNAEAIEAIYALLAARLGGDNAAFEWNNGNHFFEVPQRVAKAIAYLCKLN